MEYDSLFKAKMTQIEMVRDRGYTVPENELSYLTSGLRDINDATTKLVAQLYQLQKDGLLTPEQSVEYLDKQYKLFPAMQQKFKKDFIALLIDTVAKQGKSARQILSNVYVHPIDNKLLLVYYTDDVDATKKSIGIKAITDFFETMDNFQGYPRNSIRQAVLITPKALSAKAKELINSKTKVGYRIQVFIERDISYNPTAHVWVPKHIALTEEEATQLLEDNDANIDDFPIIMEYDIVARYYGFEPGQIIRILRRNMFETMVSESIYYRAVKE